MSVSLTDCKYWQQYCKEYFMSMCDRCEFPCVFCMIYWELEAQEKKQLSLEDDSD